MEPASAHPSQSQDPRAVRVARYPLSQALTRRVTGYLDPFRLVIAVALALAYQTGGLVSARPLLNPALILGGYFAAGLALLALNWWRALGCFKQAQIGLFADTLFLALAYSALGGLDSGLAVLLVFVSATAAILLPLRSALFIAALLTLVMLGDATVDTLIAGGRTEVLIAAGLYGVTSFLTAILVHLLAVRARDYRLIAEHQQRALTRLEQVNELIIRRMRSGVLAVDSRGEIALMNESAWFLLGNPPSTDRVLREVSPGLHDALTRWQADPRGEVEPLTLQASQALVMPKFVTLHGQRDIRVLIFLEDNEMIAQRALELSGQSLARLSGSLAHEIRNPLAAVSHAAQLLDESGALVAPDRRLVDIINKQARRMNDIVENIMQLSRRDKSRPELLDLGPWLAALAEEFQATLAARPVAVECELPEGETPAIFDRSQLHQALWKLLDNAADHAGGEGQRSEILLRLQRDAEAGYCLVSVEDNGPGIPAEHIEHIFEPFFTTRSLGSGLGLYVARQLCEANHAELTVDSTPGWKTRFHVRMAMAGRASEKQDIEEVQADT